MAANSLFAYIEGLYAPVHDELDVCLKLKGDRPEVIGSYAQNNPNPQFKPDGLYHWFDGDGMIHGVYFDGHEARYRNRYVMTDGFRLEAAAKKNLWRGILEPIDFENPHGPDKDTANTDLIFHNGQLLATWWLSGQPYTIDPRTFETIGVSEINGPTKEKIAAHPKRDPNTGELICFSYNPYSPPYLQSCVISADGTLTHHATIDCPEPSLFHDIAISQNFTIFMDLPMVWDPKAIAQGRRKVRFHRDRPARFGVMKRYGDGSQIQWFERPACYIYHTVNAWEEEDAAGNTVLVMIACRIENPLPSTMHDTELHIPRLFFLRLEPYVTEFRFNLGTGQSSERQLDDTPTEFPRMNDTYLTSRSRYAYHPRIAKEPTLLFDGCVRYDFETGEKSVISYGPDCFGSETVFAPRIGSQSENDGYVVMYVSNRREDWTELRFYDAQTMSEQPVSSFRLPRRVPIGFHAEWADLSQG